MFMDGHKSCTGLMAGVLSWLQPSQLHARSSGATLGGMSGGRASARASVSECPAFCGACILTVVGFSW